MKPRPAWHRQSVQTTVKTAAILACMAIPSIAWGWGAGHDALQRAIVGNLPKSFRDRLSDETIRTSIRAWSHYPDSFETFEAEATLLGENALATLKRYGVRRRYDLHHDRGRAVAFILLVDALRDGRCDAALFWLASLGHSTGDMAACNHDPLIHSATYDWPHIGAALPGGTPIGKLPASLDLAYAIAQPEGPAAFRMALELMKLEDDRRSPTAALLDVMMQGYEGAAFCSTRGAPILAAATAWLGGGDESARGELCRRMAELGAWATVRVTRDFAVASRLAHEGARVELSDEVITAFTARVDQWIWERSLNEESLYAPVLKPLSPSVEHAVGVVLEPTWRMNEGMLGFSDRIIAASICRTLAAAGRNYATLDIRVLARKGFPDPKQLAVAIIPAARFSDYHGLRTGQVDQHLKQYLDAGGRVLWIGGTSLPPAAALGDVRRAMTKAEKAKWPVADDRFVHGRIRLLSGSSAREWKVRRSPDTPAGWQRPYCPWRFGPLDGTSLVPLLELADGDSRYTVGAIERSEGRARAALLPTYAVHPYVLTAPPVLDAPAEPSLDEAGKAILLGTLDQLMN